MLDDCTKDLDKKLNLNHEENKKEGGTNTVNDDLGLGADIDFSKLPNMDDPQMKEAHKLFAEAMKGFAD